MCHLTLFIEAGFHFDSLWTANTPASHAHTHAGVLISFLQSKILFVIWHDVDLCSRLSTACVIATKLCSPCNKDEMLVVAFLSIFLTSGTMTGSPR